MSQYPKRITPVTVWVKGGYVRWDARVVNNIEEDINFYHECFFQFAESEFASLHFIETVPSLKNSIKRPIGR